MSGTDGADPGHLQWRAHIRRSVRGSRRADEIVQEMTSAGWAEDDAWRMVRETASKERWKAVGAMGGCAALGIAATVVTVASYGAASGGGGEYWVWWGGMLCGVVGFFWGLVRLAKIRA